MHVVTSYRRYIKTAQTVASLQSAQEATWLQLVPKSPCNVTFIYT